MQYSSKFQSFLLKATVPPLWHFGVFFFLFSFGSSNHTNLLASSWKSLVCLQPVADVREGSFSGWHWCGQCVSIGPWRRQLKSMYSHRGSGKWCLWVIGHRVVLWGSSSGTPSPSGSVTAMDLLQGAPLNSSMRLSRLTLMEGIS